MDSGGAPSDPPPDRLLAGFVGRPHGLDGSFYVEQARPELLIHGADLDVDGTPAQVSRRAGTDRHPIIRLQDGHDRAAAESIRGRGLFARRAQAPVLGPDEWWAEDLEGCTVTDGERVVGTVRRLLALPSCEVLEVARAAGGGTGDPDDAGSALLVPLVRDAVRSVDVEEQVIDIDLRFLGEAEPGATGGVA